MLGRYLKKKLKEIRTSITSVQDLKLARQVDREKMGAEFLNAWREGYN